MGLTVRLLHGVRPNAVFIHGQRHQRNTEPRGDALDEWVGQRLHAATAAGGNDRAERSRNALPAVSGEDEMIGGGGPCALRQMLGRNASHRRRSERRSLPQGRFECRLLFEAIEAFRNQRALVEQDWVIELEIDPDAARLAWRRNAASRIARDESTSSDFAHDKTATEQLGIYAACRRDGNLALVSEFALGRQPLAGLERAAGYFRGDRIRQPQIFGLRHILHRDQCFDCTDICIGSLCRYQSDCIGKHGHFGRWAAARSNTRLRRRASYCPELDHYL